MRGKKVVIIGASGYIGSALTRKLSKDNQIYAFSRFKNNELVDEFLERNVKVIRFDALKDDLSDFSNICPDYVFNTAALTWGKNGYNTEHFYRINVYLIERMFQAFSNTESIIHTSTGSVYDPTKGMIDEKSIISDPVNLYCLSKACGDLSAALCCKKYNIKTGILRYFHPYGKDSLSHGKETGRIIDYMDAIEYGREIRDMPFFNPIHISDLVDFTVNAAYHCGIPATVINIGGEKIITRNELGNTLGMLIGKNPVFGEYQVLELKDKAWACSVKRQKTLLGVQKVSLDEGIGITYDWWLKNSLYRREE